MLNPIGMIGLGDVIIVITNEPSMFATKIKPTTIVATVRLIVIANVCQTAIYEADASRLITPGHRTRYHVSIFHRIQRPSS